MEQQQRGRARNGRYTKSGEAAARAAEAIRLRSRGETYEAIAAQLGYASRGAARTAIERALAKTVVEPADELRQLQLQQLDKLTREALKVLETEHVAVSQGRVVRNDLTGEVVKDDAPVLNAIDRLLKIMERRSKLLGLDAPAKVEVMSLDAIDAEIERLSKELGRGAAGEAAAAAPVESGAGAEAEG